MNYKNMRVAILVLSSLVCLLAAFVYAQDRPSEGSSPPPRAGSDKSLLAAAPKTAAAAENNERCHCTDDSDPAAEKIARALHGPLSATGLNYTDTPLDDVLKDLQQQFAIPTYIDRAALDECGVNSDSPVTVHLHGISLQAALRLILKPLNLTYLIENEVVTITTPDKAEKELVACVYDVRDLDFNATATAKGSSPPPADKSRLAEVIIDCIATDTWCKNGGGQAEIQPLGPDLLVISQTRSAHEKIQHLLDTIRKVKSEE